MNRLFVVLFCAAALAACSKDKYKTTPTVTIDSFGPSEVNNGDLIELLATVTDKEGDLADTVTFYRKRFNGNTLLTEDSVLGAKLSRFSFPEKQKIQIDFILPYGRQYPPLTQFQNLETGIDKQFAIGIVLYDKAGNRSEYVESKKITLKKYP